MNGEFSEDYNPRDWHLPEDYRCHSPDHEVDASWEIPGFTAWLISKRKSSGKPLYPFLIDESEKSSKPVKPKTTGILVSRQLKLEACSMIGNVPCTDISNRVSRRKEVVQ